MNKNYFSSKKNNIITFLFCFTLVFSMAQNNDSRNSDFWNHVRFGGGIGLSFGSGYFSGTLAPSAIYDVNEQFAVGLGLNFTYADEKDFYTSTIFGGSILALFDPIPEIQLSAEFEELHVNRDFDQGLISNLDEEYWYPALFLGAGYRTGNVTFGIRYDVLYDSRKSIFIDTWIPFVRVYF